MVKFLIFSHLDFQLEYNFKPIHIENFLTAKPRASMIISLNINNLHWLDASLVRENLHKLEALEELYILDTKLGFAIEDVEAYNTLPKVFGSLFKFKFVS